MAVTDNDLRLVTTRLEQIERVVRFSWGRIIALLLILLVGPPVLTFYSLWTLYKLDMLGFFGTR